MSPDEELASSGPESCDATAKNPDREAACEKQVVASQGPLYRPGASHPSRALDTGPPEGVAPKSHSISLLTWNIGGKPVDDALKAIDFSSPSASNDSIIALQELPRTSPGWHTTKQEGGRLLVQYRDDDLQWRGNGIAFSPDHYVCLRRKANSIGVWVRLRHKASATEFWASSLRLSTGVSDDVTAQEIQEFLQLRPHQPERAVLLGDLNTRLTWSSGTGQLGQVRPSNGRADYLVSEVESRQFQLCPPKPAQWGTPTSRPRRAGAKGRQIDGITVRSFPLAEVHIEEKSFTQIGGDHDRAFATVALPRSEGVHDTERPTRPRMVTRNPDTQTIVNQHTLEHLAKTHTRPYPGMRRGESSLP